MKIELLFFLSTAAVFSSVPACPLLPLLTEPIDRGSYPTLATLISVVRQGGSRYSNRETSAQVEIVRVFETLRIRASILAEERERRSHGHAAGHCWGRVSLNSRPRRNISTALTAHSCTFCTMCHFALRWKQSSPLSNPQFPREQRFRAAVRLYEYQRSWIIDLPDHNSYHARR